MANTNTVPGQENLANLDYEDASDNLVQYFGAPNVAVPAQSRPVKRSSDPPNPDQKSRRFLWLLVLLLLLLGFGGLLAKRSYDTRLVELERRQSVATDTTESKLDDFNQKLNVLMVDDSQAGGTVVVGDGDTGNPNAAGTQSQQSNSAAAGAGAQGPIGPKGDMGTPGATGSQGPAGPQGPSGVASCPNGNCLSLQGSSPGAQESGSINLSGNGLFGGSVSANGFTGDGSGLTDVNATALNGATAGNSSGQISVNNGTLNTNLNADLLDGQHGSFYQDASNLNTGTLADNRLSGNVTLQGNTFNGANQLVRLTSGGILPVLDGSQLTNILASNSLQLGGQGAAYYLNATNINAGTLDDARLSTNVALKNATNTFTGTNNFAGVTATGILQNGFNVCDASNNCNYAASTGSANYIWNSTSTQTGNINIQSANPANVGLVVQGATGQSANLQEWKNAAGTTVASINSAGDQLSFGGGTITVGSGNFVFNMNSIRIPSIRQNTGTLADIGANALLTWSNTVSNAAIAVTPIATTQRGLTIRGVASQAADLLQIQNSAGTVLASITSTGVIQANAGIASGATLVLTPANGTLQIPASGSYNFGSARGIWRSGSAGIRIGTGGSSLTVRNNADTADLFSILDSTGEITFTNNVRGYNVSVASSATTTTVTFPAAHQNANYAVLCTPNWNTTCWVSNKTANGFTLNYGTAAPAGQLVDWFVVH